MSEILPWDRSGSIKGRYCTLIEELFSKYLEETSITSWRPIDSPMDPNQKSMATQCES